VLPEELCPVAENTKKIVARFYAACIGWVRYKPLLVFITQRESYDDTITMMKESFAKTLPMLCEFFDNPKFMNIARELEKFDNNVELHYKAFESTKKAWQKLAGHLQGRR